MNVSRYYTHMTREQLIQNLATIDYITNNIRLSIISLVCRDKYHVGGVANPTYQAELREKVQLGDISDDSYWTATGLTYVDRVCYVNCDATNHYGADTWAEDARFRLDEIADHVPLAKILEQLLDNEEPTNG